jgi:hypothetical protein
MVASTVSNNDALQLFYNAYLFGCDDNVAAFAILSKKYPLLVSFLYCFYQPFYKRSKTFTFILEYDNDRLWYSKQDYMLHYTKYVVAL